MRRQGSQFKQVVDRLAVFERVHALRVPPLPIDPQAIDVGTGELHFQSEWLIVPKNRSVQLANGPSVVLRPTGRMSKFFS